MLKVTDFGCDQHQWRQFAIFPGPGEADFMIDILYNLPREGDYHTFICEHGQTHYVIFQMPPMRFAAVGPKRAILQVDG
jgi:hypothetical protein